MLMYFIYKNNTFNFSIKNDVSITYLKNLASKMIKQDKSSFDLFYNNKILSETDSSLFHISNKEANIPIIISLKKNHSGNKEVKLPLLTLPNKSNLNLNESDIYTESFSREMNNFSKNYSNKKNGKIKLKEKKDEYISINTVFEDVYNSKDDEIFLLMKNLANKILELDNTLYKKFKTSYSKDNTQLLLFEQNILNFKDKQIKYFKKLINYFDNTDSSFFSKGKFNLDEFYLELSNYNNNRNININNTYYTKINTNNKNSIDFNNNISKSAKKELKKISTKSLKIESYLERKLPNISIIKSSDDNNNIYNSNKISENSESSDEIIKEKIDKIDTILKNKKIIDNKIKKDIYLNKSTKIQGNTKLELKKNLMNFDINEKSNKNNNNILNKKNITIINEENDIIDEKNSFKELNYRNKTINASENKAINKIENKTENNIKKKSEKKIDNKVDNKLDNKIKNKSVNINQNIVEIKTENKTEKKIDNKINNKNINKINNDPLINQDAESEDRIQMENYNKDKIDILFEISEHQNEADAQSLDDSKSEDENVVKKKRYSVIRQKTLNLNQSKNFKNRYSLQIRDRKKSHRIKKLGTNVYDFII